MILGLELCWFRLGHWRQTGAGIETAAGGGGRKRGRREISKKKGSMKVRRKGTGERRDEKEEKEMRICKQTHNRCCLAEK